MEDHAHFQGEIKKNSENTLLKAEKVCKITGTISPNNCTRRLCLTRIQICSNKLRATSLSDCSLSVFSRGQGKYQNTNNKNTFTKFKNLLL